jgi:hypothetical protein
MVHSVLAQPITHRREHHSEKAHRQQTRLEICDRCFINDLAIYRTMCSKVKQSEFPLLPVLLLLPLLHLLFVLLLLLGFSFEMAPTSCPPHLLCTLLHAAEHSAGGGGGWDLHRWACLHVVCPVDMGSIDHGATKNGSHTERFRICCCCCLNDKIGSVAATAQL